MGYNMIWVQFGVNKNENFSKNFSLWKSAYYTKFQEKLCHYFLIMYKKERPQKVKADEILKACAAICNFALVLQLSTRVVTLHSR